MTAARRHGNANLYPRRAVPALADGGAAGHHSRTLRTPHSPAMEYPLLVEEYGLIPDSGGAGGRWGGLGLRRVVRPVGHDRTFNGLGERFRHEPWGLGPPAKRGAADLEADRRSGKFSAEYLARHYP